MQKKQIQLSDYLFQSSYKVLWGQMDAARHVNNLVYLKWAEAARIEYFEKMNMATGFTGEGGQTGPILGWQECKYIFPMTSPDVAIVGIKTTEILKDRFILESSIFSEKHGRIAAVSRQSVIPYDYKNLRKTALPESWKKAIEILEKRTFNI